MKINVYSEKSGNFGANSEKKPMIIIESKKRPLEPGKKDKNGKPILSLKEKYPDAVLLFRCGDFYETYMDDATTAANILGITMTRSTNQKEDDGSGLRMAGFPYFRLEEYMQKLIRAGHRIAICDQIGFA